MNELLALSVPEKLAVIDALADSLDDPTVPPWQLDEVQRRLADDLNRPEAEVAWEDAVRRVSGRP
jgi:hypothetical protein